MISFVCRLENFAQKALYLFFFFFYEIEGTRKTCFSLRSPQNGPWKTSSRSLLLIGEEIEKLLFHAAEHVLVQLYEHCESVLPIPLTISQMSFPKCNTPTYHVRVPKTRRDSSHVSPRNCRSDPHDLEKLPECMP